MTTLTNRDRIMDEMERDELSKLSVAKAEADMAFHAWNYTNVAGLTHDERLEVHKRGDQLYAAVVEANAAQRGFMNRLAKRVEDQAALSDQPPSGG